MMLGECACPILLPCEGCRLHVKKAGRELFSIQRGTDGLPIVVRPVTDKLKSLSSNWVELGNSCPESAAQCVLLSRSTLASEKKLQCDDMRVAANGCFHYQRICHIFLLISELFCL